MIEWQNVLYCVQSSRLSSEELSSTEKRIGEECIYLIESNTKKIERTKKKAVRYRVGRNVCVSHGLVGLPASQISRILCLSPRSFEWPLERAQKNSKLATAPAKPLVYMLVSPSAGRNPADYFRYCIFTYHNLISLNLIDILAASMALNAFSFLFPGRYQVGGKSLHRRRWYWNCKYFWSPLVIATVGVGSLTLRCRVGEISTGTTWSTSNNKRREGHLARIFRSGWFFNRNSHGVETQKTEKIKKKIQCQCKENNIFGAVWEVWGRIWGRKRERRRCWLCQHTVSSISK